MREFDIVIFGATGEGEHAVERETERRWDYSQSVVFVRSKL
jgi:uncharacterized protein (UPF0261 family)